MIEQVYYWSSWSDLKRDGGEKEMLHIMQYKTKANRKTAENAIVGKCNY